MKLKNAFLALFLLVPSAFAQFLGYVSPQTVSQHLAANLACTGAIQRFITSNLGQTTHVLQWVNTPASSHITVSLNASNDGIGFFTFSDVATVPSGILQATGYYPVVAAEVVCPVGGTFTLDYQGTSTFALQPTGFANRAEFVKAMAISAPANANFSQIITVPYGSSGGLLYFSYGGAPGEPAGSTLTVTASGLNVSGLAPITLLPAQVIAQNANLQAFIVPAVPTVQITLTYTSGGASTQPFSAEVDFFKPGQQPYSADPCKFVGLAAQIPNCPTLP